MIAGFPPSYSGRYVSCLLWFVCFSHGESSDFSAVFHLQRELPEVPPPRAHWYQQATAPCLKSEGLTFRTFACIASKGEAEKILNEAETGITLESRGRTFRLKTQPRSALQPIEVDSSIKEYLVGDTPPLTDGLRERTFSVKRWPQLIGRYLNPLLDETVADAICGYEVTAEKSIRASDPVGLLSRGKLHRLLRKQAVFVSDTMGPQLDFRGIGDKRNFEGFAGILSNAPATAQVYRIRFCDLSQDITGEAIVTTCDGWASWKVITSKPTPNGVVQLFTDGGVLVGSETFHIRTGINVSLNFDTPAPYRDLYGRPLKELEVKKTGAVVKNLTWHPGFQAKPQAFSDALCAVLSSLGPHVLFHDPYFIGTPNLLNGAIVDEAAKVFMNALITAMAQSPVLEINILIDSNRMGLNQAQVSQLVGVYRRIFEPLRRLGLKRALLGFSRFHDRYYLGMEETDGVKALYKASKSVNGFLETDEIDISLDTNIDAHLVVARMLARWDRANKQLLVS